VVEPNLEAVAESIPHIVWLSDAEGSTDYFNERGTDYTGFPRQANYGWRWVELVHPEDAVRARLGWDHAARTVTPYELTYRIRRSDGAFRWHAFRALPVRDRSGGILRWIGTADDLTDRPDPVDEALVERQVSELRAMFVAAGGSEADVPLADLSEGADGVDLKPRDLTVAFLVAEGHTSAEIANRLGVSLRTIEATRSRLRRVLGLPTRADLVRFVRDHELGAR